jgi:hypothetical protein
MYVCSPRSSLLTCLLCLLCQFDLSYSALASTSFSFLVGGGGVPTRHVQHAASWLAAAQTSVWRAAVKGPGPAWPGHARHVPSTRPVKRDGTTGLVWLVWLVWPGWSGWSGWESGTANATAMIQEPEAEVSACGGRATWGLSALRSTVGRLESVGPIGCRKTRRHSSESPDGPRRHMTCTFVAFLAPRRGVFGCRPCMS